MPSHDQLIPLSVAAREVPNRNGERGVNVSTVWRWSLRGIRGVRLRTEMVGGTRMTKLAWLDEFYGATTAAVDGVRPSTPNQRNRAIEAAEAELAQAGI